MSVESTEESERLFISAEDCTVQITVKEEPIVSSKDSSVNITLIKDDVKKEMKEQQQHFGVPVSYQGKGIEY